MAYSSPATAVTGDVIPAAFWNTNGRDNILETAPAKVTTKGDIVAATAANAIARLAVGGNGTILKANSGASAGVDWAGDERATTIITGGPVSTSADGWSDVLSGTIAITWTSTIMAMCVADKNQTAADGWGRSRLVIDGTAQPETNAQSPGAGNTRQIALVGRKASVGAGTITVKLQHYDETAPDERATYSNIAILVIARQE